MASHALRGLACVESILFGTRDDVESVVEVCLDRVCVCVCVCVYVIVTRKGYGKRFHRVMFVVPPFGRPSIEIEQLYPWESNVSGWFHAKTRMPL